ncbi:hypothetical protein MVES1_003265 [Malassezia vespertilionis]|uniref:uncharacterized protein n=1 Tax=Malassezia vespertilionis TaxID=2020962 RepID=UPI0024B21E1B|nr:uncharacterized protein MVES1_003265 [Malassezia vespertilionis]WFD07897.1 hypothetical protein MVES1_003265 [Malassezia vespertilionis]
MDHCGRNVISTAASRGVAELKTQCNSKIEYARARAQQMQQPSYSTLAASASSIQERDKEHRVRRETNEALRASRGSVFGQKATVPIRNERLELVEALERGPHEFTPPNDDPEFALYEPNSRMRVRNRQVSHAQLQQYLECRYIVNIGTLYNLAGRTGKSLSEYQSANDRTMDGDVEVPLYGDWVLFAVMGEKSAMKYTAGRVDDTQNEASPRGSDAFARENPTKPARKFFSCKLLNLSTDVIETHRAMPGHCMLTMMLFESKETHSNADGTTRFSGGSGGAFEKLWKERDGMLLAILNPRIMKPRRNDASKNLTITPRSADSVLVLGHADAYAQCQAIRKDGSRCTAFVMKTAGNNGVCDFHLERAVTSNMRSRMEFASSTASMLGKPTSDTAKQMHGIRSRHVRPSGALGISGLDADVAPARTYVVNPSREILSVNDPRTASYNVEARYGRGRAEKEQRKRKQEADAHLGDKVQASNSKQQAKPCAAAPRRARKPGLTETRNAEEKFLAEVDQNSLAAKTLRIAQATLRGEFKPGQKNSRQRSSNDPGRALQNSDVAARLLSRHQATGDALPQARLRGKKFRSNVLDRDGPASRHVQELEEDDDNDLIII